MAISARDKVKVVSSLARWLAGLEPMYGRSYYFEKFSSARRAVERIKEYVGMKVCPFCKRRFRKPSAFVSHIVMVHVYDIELLLESEE
ncbi:MAG: hypothetical protein QXF05_02815 [Thermofilaceae archaeon]